MKTITDGIALFPLLDTPLLRSAGNLAFITIQSFIERYMAKYGHSFPPSLEISLVSTKTTWQVTLCDPMWHMDSRSGEM